MNSHFRINFNKYFAVVLALYPLLGMYGYFIDGLALADVFLIVGLILYFLSGNKIHLFNKSTVGWGLYYVISVLSLGYVLLFSSIYSETLVTTRCIKFGYIIFCILALVPNSVDEEKYWNVMRALCIVVVVGLLVQYVGYYLFGRYFWLKIPFLNYVSEALEGTDIRHMQMSAAVFRPNSIFFEPAGCAYVLCMEILHLLFEEKQTKSDLYEALFFTFGVVLSVSSTGLIVGSSLWIIYFLVGRKEPGVGNYKMVKKTTVMFSMICLCIIFMILRNTVLIESFIRLEKYSDQNAGAWSRLFAGSDLVQSLEGVNLFIGMGLGNLPVMFINSFNFIIYCTGFVGFIFIIGWLIYLFTQCNLEGRIAVLLVAAMFSMRPLIYAGSLMIYACIIAWNFRKVNRVRIS